MNGLLHKACMWDNDYGASGIGTYMTWPAIIDHSGRIISDFMGGHRLP